MASTSGLGASLVEIKTDIPLPAVAVEEIKAVVEKTTTSPADKAAETTSATTMTASTAEKPAAHDAPTEKAQTLTPHKEEEEKVEKKDSLATAKKEEEEEQVSSDEEYDEEEYDDDDDEHYEDDDDEEEYLGKNENGEVIVDLGVFDQLLEMDDDDDRDFSKSIVINFFEQAKTTFLGMVDAIESRDLEAYAKLGHFLKGSSATLGLQKVEETCEKIQHCQASADEATMPEIDNKAALARGSELLEQLKAEYRQAELYLCKFYQMPPPPVATLADA